MECAIGIAVLDYLPLGVDRAETASRHCTFVGEARRGRVLWASAEDVTCLLARFNLGLDLPDERTLEALAATLVGWGTAKDLKTARRFLSLLSPLPFGERVFVYAPLEALPFPPDLVLRILRPEEAMRRLYALVAATGERAHSASGGPGALCGDCTALPLLTGRPALSAGCRGSRREVSLAEEELFLALPYPLDSLAGLP